MEQLHISPTRFKPYRNEISDGCGKKSKCSVAPPLAHSAIDTIIYRYAKLSPPFIYQFGRRNREYPKRRPVDIPNFSVMIMAKRAS